MSFRCSIKLPGESGGRPAKNQNPTDHEGAACAPPASETLPPLVPATSADLVVAMRRLVLQVVNAALTLCDKLPVPAWGEDVEGFCLRGLLDERAPQTKRPPL